MTSIEKAVESSKDGSIMETGCLRVDGSKEEKISNEEISRNPRVQLITLNKRHVDLNIIVGGKLLVRGPDPTAGRRAHVSL